MLRLRFFAVILVLLLCLPGNIRAFFPETGDIAAGLGESVGGIESLKVRITFDNHPGVELLVWQDGAQWRQEWVENVNGTAVLSAASIGRDTRLLEGYPAGTLFTAPPFWFWKQDDPIVWWSRLGVDPEIKSYQFLEGRPCIVLGAKTGDTVSPQVWIDMERDVPLRVRSASGPQWDWLEYRYISNHYLPHKAAAYGESENATRMALEWRGINSEHPRHLYDRTAFASRFSVPPGGEPLPVPLYMLQTTLPVALP